VLKSNPASRTTYWLASGENAPWGIADEGSRIWLGCHISPAKLIRVLKSNPASRTTYTFESGENSALAVAQDGTYVWVGLNTTPAKVIKFWQ